MDIEPITFPTMLSNLLNLFILIVVLHYKSVLFLINITTIGLSEAFDYQVRPILRQFDLSLNKKTVEIIGLVVETSLAARVETDAHSILHTGSDEP